MAGELRWFKWFIFAVAAVIGGVDGGVTYDRRSLIINGERKLLFSGSIHYPRSTPDMWPFLIRKAKNGGLDTIDTYVFWNIHEPQPGQYDFSGRKDIVSFIKLVQEQGLYVCLRIGPYIESEWNYGGFPFWLHDVPNIVFRTDNEPFKLHMQNFVTKIVNMLKSEKLFASQGGPIILSQIENEYQNIEKAFDLDGPKYVDWAAKMAVGLDTGVPWVMCKQTDAPDPVINTCNGRKCGETFVGPNSPNKPALWTENWTHFYDVYGNNTKVRTAEDIAYQVALFIAKMNGSFINYYMYHGGTNFGRTAASFVLTSYYDEAPLDEYGLIRQPKWGHLKDLHTIIKRVSHTMLYGKQTNYSLGPSQEAYIYHGDDDDECVAFLINTDESNNEEVRFLNQKYQIPQGSISILPDCKNVAFNTAKISNQFGTRTRTTRVKLDSEGIWNQWSEAVLTYDDTKMRSNKLLEQMSTTKDTSDYLWYTTTFKQSNEGDSVVNISSNGHVLRAYVNGELVGSGHGAFRTPHFTLVTKARLRNGKNDISLLSVMVGLPDSGAYLEKRVAGLENVYIQDGQNVEDLTEYSWGYQVGLLGEKNQIYKEGSNDLGWSKYETNSKPLTWYKTRFDEPDGIDPVALNLASMGKGEVWVNGESIGRYWISYREPDGSPSQIWYHIPRSFLKQKDNLLVIFEEETGNPLNITVDTVSVTEVCGQVSSSNLPRASQLVKTANLVQRPNIELACPLKRKISKILFASYGNPSGDCRTGYDLGKCHSINSTTTVAKMCIGRRKCQVPLSSEHFGGDPCPGITKSLLVEAQCRHRH